jgi:hypothetical protein
MRRRRLKIVTLAAGVALMAMLGLTITLPRSNRLRTRFDIEVIARNRDHNCLWSLGLFPYSGPPPRCHKFLCTQDAVDSLVVIARQDPARLVPYLGDERPGVGFDYKDEPVQVVIARILGNQYGYRPLRATIDEEDLVDVRRSATGLAPVISGSLSRWAEFVRGWEEFASGVRPEPPGR